MQQSYELNRKRSTLMIFVVVSVFAIWGFLLYSITFKSPFIFDDIPRIKENLGIRVTELSAESLIEAAFGAQSAKARPLGNITFALNYYFNQYDPEGYRIVNVIIHVLAGIILYLFIKTTLSLPSVKPKYTQVYAIAFFAAMIWLAHPIATQSVTYIIQRLNSLAALFFVLSFYLFLRGRLSGQPAKKWSWFGAAALSWVLALGCKQNAATLPFFIFLYEWYFFQDLSPKWLKSSLKYIIAVVIVFAAVAFLYLGADPLEKISKLRDFSQGEFTLAERALTQTRVVVYYLSLIFFPHPSRLNLDYDFPLSQTLFNPITTLFSLILIIGLIALAFYLAKKERLISFCILWFFGNLVIESSIIPLAIIFEHRTYLPAMLVCLIPVILIYRYVQFDWLKIGLPIVLIAGISVWTYQRNRVWETDLSFWADCVEKSPDKARPHLNYGKSFSNLGKIAEAVEQYTEALRINPKYAKAHFNLGNAMLKQGKTDEAIRHFSEASRLGAGLPEAHINIGMILLKKGRIDEAIQQYRQALNINPKHAQANLNIGVAMIEQGKFTQAATYFEKALKIDPNYGDAHYHLAIIMEKQGKINEAIDHYAAALEKNPNNADVYYNLANIFFKQGNENSAVTHYKKALAIKPDFPQAINNLALLNASRKDYPEALSLFLDVLNHWPDDAETHYNIACMYSRLKRVDESIEWLGMAINKGYHNWEKIKLDGDLDNIRNSPEYRKLIEGH